MKTANNYLEEANAAVPRIPGADAVSKHGSQAVFIDVRDSGAIKQSGTIAGAQRVPRGMLEFMADETHQFHNKALTKDSDIYIVCGLGGQAALAGKTMLDMGFDNVTNIGGIGEWKEAGGPMED